LIPGSLCQYSEINGRLIPDYLGASDIPWLEALIDEFMRFEGRTVRELNKRLFEPLPVKAPEHKLRMALHVMGRMWRGNIKPVVKPAELRCRVFTHSMAVPFSSESFVEPVSLLKERKKIVFQKISDELKIPTEKLEEALFADLPGERLLIAPEKGFSPYEIVLKTNLALAQGFIFRAREIRISLIGNSRAIIRHAKFKGLICSIKKERGESVSSPVSLYISGPLSLFQKTCIYGRALAGLIPLLCHSNSFELRAKCCSDIEELEFLIRPADPIFPAEKIRKFDSKLEKFFSRDFQKKAEDWDIIREPEPIVAGDSLIFPDFRLHHRRCPGRSWFLEIVGFWTTEYIKNKIEKLKMAKITNLIICVNSALNCSENDFPDCSKVIFFNRHIDTSDVLRIIDPHVLDV